ncbi:hypothetical protein BpHYR1_031551 [Brachionus plicatilis]|uniref:Uncharacterized protein n=1 Tax=Brachionus plicatilis TaxID=10195 RepID=A0A3M7QAV3_BRAPC|nr:hypothetical protein BpHYR1_031551 [Brachionus plicatilis]
MTYSKTRNSAFYFVLSVQFRDLGVVLKYRFLVKNNQKISQKTKLRLNLIKEIFKTLQFEKLIKLQKPDFTFGGLPRFLFGSTSHGITSSAFRFFGRPGPL